MKALTVVEHLDVLEDVRFGLAACRVVAVMNPFGFQGGKETLHRGVIIDVAGTTHAGQCRVA